MHQLTGYVDRWSAKQGGTLRFMVSSAGGRDYALRFVRHLCADPNPAGPGYHEVPMPTGLDGTRPGTEQGAWLGSFGHARIGALPGGTLTLRATIWPTTPRKGVQGVLALAAPGWRFALGIGPDGAFAEATGTAGPVRAATGRKLLERRWYDLTATIALDGTLSVEQRPHAPLGDAGQGSARGAQAGATGAEAFIAALPPDGGGAPATAHFNGKIERPAILGANGPVAEWDFSIGIPTQTATDIGPHGAHARLVNLPTRAMTGAAWTGAVHDWKSAPQLYGAIHFHDDDQGPLGWQESFALVIPPDWPSGFYAAHLSNEAGEDYIPFIVRPAKPQSDVVLLVPTFSYQVYGCYVRPGRGAEIAARAAQWGALPETPDMNPQFGLSCYNHHSDGSGVALMTQHRPMLDTRPKQFSLMDPVEGASGTGRWVVDNYFDQFLRTIGVAHDVITDHDLHADGLAALTPYRLVIAAQHPEYHSERMMQAFEDFLGQGGRLMYMGGNGFYWRAEPSQEQPETLEVRRAEGGIRVWETFPGESYNQFGGGYGGLWRRIGRSSHKLVGISFSTQGRHLGFPYRLIDGIRDPRVAFMTDGIPTASGTVFGDAGYMGGGAAGFELDSVNAKYGTPPHALVVAKGVVIHPDYAWVNEDMLTHRHPLPQEDWSCADMTFFETAAGGAVFSVGSMTYAGSLMVNGGDTVLGRLTANVVRRFADPAPFTLPAMP
ncbi:N,N-dimethylformamidase beta subunit family domain-containing protein [Methylocella sp.]|uniref:N,N-dimethylformamidase beta subunit family domain-containing protein n=1 Tax=Methylocella sp. TaxID=1978226 RepID=UPI0037848E41